MATVNRPPRAPESQPASQPRPIVTLALIAVNLASFGFLMLFDGPWRDSLALHFVQHPEFALWQLGSHLFVHDGPIHLLLNMMVLWFFGRVLEQIWGHRMMLCLYLLIGIAAAGLYLLLNLMQFQYAAEAVLAAGLTPIELQDMLDRGQYIPVIEQTITVSQLYNTVAVGASGAIFGLLVCFTVLFPRYKLMLLFIPIPIAARILIPALLVMELFSAITGHSLFGENIAHLAHLTGALMGLIVVLLWRRWFRARHAIRG